MGPSTDPFYAIQKAEWRFVQAKNGSSLCMSVRESLASSKLSESARAGPVLRPIQASEIIKSFQKFGTKFFSVKIRSTRDREERVEDIWIVLGAIR